MELASDIISLEQTRRAADGTRALVTFFPTFQKQNKPVFTHVKTESSVLEKRTKVRDILKNGNVTKV
jgi:hypothetical protein